MNNKTKDMKKVELVDSLNIHDSSIEDIRIYNDDLGVLCINITLALTTPRNTYLRFSLKNVLEFYTYWSKEYYFLTVTSYKLLKRDEDDAYYCCFIPDELNTSISDEDDFTLLAKILNLCLQKTKSS